MSGCIEYSHDLLLANNLNIPSGFRPLSSLLNHCARLVPNRKHVQT